MKETTRREEAHKLAIEQIKQAGESIIENAERLAGGYKYQTGDVDITITVNPDNSAPVIDVRQSLFPESWVESYQAEE